MQVFNKQKNVTTKLVNQLWQSDYLQTNARNVAMEMMGKPRSLHHWITNVFLVLAVVFMCASILLFFAFNWYMIHPFIKMGSILGLIAILATANYVALKKQKQLVADLILTANCFLIGVFMAVFGQIYQTGADAYTLFLTWAIMVIPFAIGAKFLPLWSLWLIVANVALITWLNVGFKLGFVDIWFDEATLVAVFNLLIYALFTIYSKSKHGIWIDKYWVKLVLAIFIFAPLTLFIIGEVFDYRFNFKSNKLLIASTIFALFYLYIKFVAKSIAEYNVGFFAIVAIIIGTIIRFSYEYANDSISVVFLSLANLIVIGTLLKYAYQYYISVTAKMAGE